MATETIAAPTPLPRSCRVILCKLRGIRASQIRSFRRSSTISPHTLSRRSTPSSKPCLPGFQGRSRTPKDTGCLRDFGCSTPALRLKISPFNSRFTAHRDRSNLGLSGQPERFVANADPKAIVPNRPVPFFQPFLAPVCLASVKLLLSRCGPCGVPMRAAPVYPPGRLCLWKRIRHKLATSRRGPIQRMADFCGSQRTTLCGVNCTNLRLSFRNNLPSR